MSRERRQLFPVAEEPLAEPGRYGCPMLLRTRVQLSGSPRPLMRCGLGWALHNELEVARCAATDVITDCWKVHPERTPVVVLPAVGAGKETEPEPARVKVAGD